ncbi:hypothetical protein ACFY1L_10275 [Streptomyces sp. NPDC001663]
MTDVMSCGAGRPDPAVEVDRLGRPRINYQGIKGYVALYCITRP